MKKFTKNIAERIKSNSHVKVAILGNYTSVQWGQSMSHIGNGYVYKLANGYIYILSWEIQKDGSVEWVERDSDYNTKSNTGITCICDQISLDGDALYVTIEDLEKEKTEILAAAAEITKGKPEKINNFQVWRS